MGKQNFPMRGDSPSVRPASAKSVLERANDLFRFEDAIRGENLPPLDIPAELIPPPLPPLKPAGSKGNASPSSDFEASEAAPSGLVTDLAKGYVSSIVASPAPGGAATPAEVLPRARDWSGPVQKLNHEKMAEFGYMVPGAPVNRTSEEFRIIKRELLSRIRGGRQQEAIPNGNILLIASAHAGDGKTYCSVNLALSLAAESGLEVLLIDADIAKPSIAANLGLTTGKGLMDALVDRHLPVEELVIRTDVPTFSVLPAGQSTDKDAERLASARMGELIGALVAQRPERILIFDSPPLLAASPASVLAAHVGQTVLVVRADRTTEGALRDAAGLLKECPHVHLLLNGVQFSTSGRQFGSYYGREAE